MTALILRIAFGTLGIAFIIWWLYVTYLGLSEFFRPNNGKNNKKNNNTKNNQ